MPEPWSPAEARWRISAYARDEWCDIFLTRHAEERLEERGLTVGDVLHVLRNGHVYDEAEPATQAGLHRYRVESETPNSGGRRVRVVVVPAPGRPALKIVTVMWIDE